MKKRANMPHRRQSRRVAAALREVEAEHRHPDTQLKRLDKRLGHGVGAERERARLCIKLDIPF